MSHNSPTPQQALAATNGVSCYRDATPNISAGAVNFLSQLPLEKGTKIAAAVERAASDGLNPGDPRRYVPDSRATDSTLKGLLPMHSDSTRPSIRVDLIGLEPRARERFEAVFRDLGQGAYWVVNSTVAEVAIIDLDNPDGTALWHRYCHQFPQRPVILLSDTDLPLETRERFLRKPIHVDTLLEALEEIRRRLDALGRNVNSRAMRERADEVEPNTIKITEQSALVPAGGSIWPRESPLAGTERAGESTPSGESNMSCCPLYGGDVDTDREGGASAFQPSLENAPQAPTQRRTTSPALPEESLELDGTTEKTYRYPRAPRSDTDADRAWSEQQPYSQASFTPTSEDPDEEVHELEFSDVTRRVRTDRTSPPATSLLAVHERLLGLVQTALKSSASTQHAVELTLETGSLVVHAPQGRLHSSFTDQQLKQLAKRILPSTAVSIRPAQTDSLDTFLSATTPASALETVEAFLWKLALWTYQGCLPLGTQLEQRVYLRHWPNLTRLHPVPDAMRIASLWSEQPMTLGYTATALGIPQQHVFNFYCASHTIGLAGQARREADYLFQEASAHSKGKRHFMSDMMKRLRFIGNN